MRIALIGGQGWPLTETVAGLPTLERRLRALSIEAEQFSHSNRQGIRDYLIRQPGYDTWVGLVGDSLGAGAAALYAGDHAGHVNFVGGFQPSVWDPIGHGPVTDRTITVAPNVLVAHCIWNPSFFETAGLGNARYVITHGAQTILTTTQHHGTHPDDWGYAQDLMLAHIQQLKEKK